MPRQTKPQLTVTEPSTIIGEVVRTNYGVSQTSKGTDMPWFSMTLRVDYRSLNYKEPEATWSVYYNVSFRWEAAKQLTELELQQGQVVKVYGYIVKDSYEDKKTGEKKEGLKIAWPEFDFDDYYRRTGGQPAVEEEIDLSVFDLDL